MTQECKDTAFPESSAHSLSQSAVSPVSQTLRPDAPEPDHKTMNQAEEEAVLDIKRDFVRHTLPSFLLLGIFFGFLFRCAACGRIAAAPMEEFSYQRECKAAFVYPQHISQHHIYHDTDAGRNTHQNHPWNEPIAHPCCQEMIRQIYTEQHHQSGYCHFTQIRRQFFIQNARILFHCRHKQNQRCHCGRHSGSQRQTAQPHGLHKQPAQSGIDTNGNDASHQRHFPFLLCVEHTAQNGLHTVANHAHRKEAQCRSCHFCSQSVKTASFINEFYQWFAQYHEPNHHRNQEKHHRPQGHSYGLSKAVPFCIIDHTGKFRENQIGNGQNEYPNNDGI